MILEKMLLKLDEVGRLLNVSKSKLQVILNDKDNCLNRFKMGSAVRVKKEDLENFLKKDGGNA